MTDRKPDDTCTWSGLPEWMCRPHCDVAPPVIAKPTQLEIEQELWDQVKDALREKALQVSYPLPAGPRESRRTGGHFTARVDKDNVPALMGRDLTLIASMFAHLQEEAQNRPNDRDFPGGDALVMLGPGANVEAFSYIQISALVGRIDEDSVAIPTKEDLQTPLATLTSWTQILRAAREQPATMKATIESELKYIRDSIDWMFSLDEEGQRHFGQIPDLAASLSRVRRKLEDILKDGTRAEFTRVNCIAPECEGHPRLMKLYSAKVAWDRYRCPECRTEYDKPQFDLAKSQNLLSRGVEKFMPPREAADSSGVPIKTVYTWMRRRKAERVWVTPVDANPFALVWWPDIRALAIDRRDKLDRQAERRAELKAQHAEEAKRKAAAQKDASDTPKRGRRAS